MPFQLRCLFVDVGKYHMLGFFAFMKLRKNKGGWPKKGTPLRFRAKKGDPRRIFNSARHTLTDVYPFLALNLRGVPFISIRVELYPFLPLNCTLFWPKTYSFL